MFAAMAKLPRLNDSCGNMCCNREDVDEKKRRVEKVIGQLNLTQCAETYMGNRLIRGVSGGEMKRTGTFWGLDKSRHWLPPLGSSAPCTSQVHSLESNSQTVCVYKLRED